MKILKFWEIAILLLLFMGGPHAQEWVIGEGMCPAAGHTPEEALEQAVQAAMRDAIARHCGANIVSQTVVQNFMLGADVIENITSGHVVEYEVVKRWEENPDPENNPLNDLIKVQLKARVVCDTTPSDPYFKLDASLNKLNLIDGEEVQLTVTPSRSCYLTVLNIMADQSIYQLYPLKNLPQQEVQAGETWQYPLHLIAQCPPGRDKVTETIYIIATREPVQLITDQVQQETHWQGEFLVWNTPQTCWKTIVSSLVRIPRSQRTSVVLSYTIHRK